MNEMMKYRQRQSPRSRKQSMYNHIESLSKLSRTQVTVLSRNDKTKRTSISVPLNRHQSLTNHIINYYEASQIATLTLTP